MLRVSCPSCAAPIIFANKGSLGAVCGSCQTTVKRQGASIDNYGKVGEIREDATPLCVGTTGKYRDKAFTLVGRIQLQYLEGTWNEWHMAFSDGSFAWLAEATGFFSVHYPVTSNVPDKAFNSYKPDDNIVIGTSSYVVRNVGNARCVAGEGELPFAVNDGYELPFVDFVSEGNPACGTIDYSDVAPRLFVGQFVEFEDLELKGLREELPPDHPMARIAEGTGEKLDCPNCGGTIERRTGSQSPAIYCQYCGSGIDLTGDYKLFAEYKFDGLPEGTLNLGDKGSWDGDEYTVLAIMEREATEWNVVWLEYLLHNPKRGYRWLIEDAGHWTWVTPIPEHPNVIFTSGSYAEIRGAKCKHAETNAVRVNQVVGELYWRVRAGDTVTAMDYITPPFMLSKEKNNAEVSWSLGRYVEADEIKDAFSLNTVNIPIGIKLHQPSPADIHLKPMWRRFLLACLLIGLWSADYVFRAPKQVVANESLTMSTVTKAPGCTQPWPACKVKYAQKPQLENVRWLGPFDVPDGPTTVEIKIDAELNNAWMWAGLALYNEANGEAVDFGKTISYYKDADGTYGSRDESVIVPQVKQGRYFLRIEPLAGVGPPRPIVPLQRIKYRVTVTRGVPMVRWPLLAILVLLVPIGFLFIRRLLFEMKRQQWNG